MDVFKDYLDKIPNPAHQQRTREVLAWVHTTYPQLDRRIAWSNPHFTHQGTFIIAFSLAAKHLAVTPESKPLTVFADAIKAAGYDATAMIFRIPWDREVDFTLLRTLIDYNLKDKQGLATYWRKPGD